MKGEHRKDLQTNILADRMGRFMHDMRESPQSRSAAIITLLGLAVLTYIGWQWAMSRTGSNELWAALDEDAVAQSAGDNENRQLDRMLKRVADEAPATLVGRTARFQRARLLLATGLTRLYSQQHAEAATELKTARQLYRGLIDQSRDEPLLAQEALMGVAQAEEALVGVPDPDDAEKAMGTLDQAVVDYRTLATRFPGSYLGQQAIARLKKIEENRKDVDDFYAKMRKEAASRPAFGLPPGDGG